MARPRKVIDASQVATLASYGLTAAEIGAVLGCSADTLERRFAASLKEGREMLNGNLKRRQVEVAMQGNVGMLVWLGKQYLGQRDKQELTGKDGEDFPATRIEIVNAPQK